MKKKFLVILIFIVFIFSLGLGKKIHVEAQTIESSIDVENNKMKQGEEQNILLKVDKDKKVNVIKAKIEYDTDFWEEINEENFSTKNN